MATAITVCETMESARKDTSTIKSPINSASVNAAKSRYRKTKTQPAMRKEPPSTANMAKCPWCRGPGWHAKKGQCEKCPAKNQTYSKCSKKGHFKSVCRSTSAPSKSSISAVTSSVNTNVAEVDEQTPVVPITFNGVHIDSRPDTVANIDAMGPEHLSKLGLKPCNLEKVTDTTMAANQSTFTAVENFQQQ